MARLPAFVGPWNAAQAVVSAPDRLVNWIPAQIQPDTGPAAWVLDPAPGCGLFGFLLGENSTTTRGTYELNNIAYFVIGAALYRVTASSGTAALFTGIAGSGFVSIASNSEAGNQVMIASDTGVLYVYNVSTLASATITTVSGTKVAFLDTYFIALDTATSTIFVSAQNDGTSWDPLDAAQRNDSADKWKAMIVRLKDLLLFGSDTTSVYEDTGGDFPFTPNPSVLINRGIFAADSLCMLQNSPIWLADDLTVRHLRGYEPVRVSTHAIEYAISQWTDADAAFGMVYDEQGHAVYVLTSSTDDESFGFDLTTGLWHQRAEGVASSFGALTVCCAVKVGDLQLVGSHTDKYVYYWSQTYPYDPSQNAGTPTQMSRLRRAPNLVSELNRVIYDRFQLFMEVGTANASPPGNAPTALLQWSDDGGQTFNAGVSVSIGTHNAFDTRVIWRRLGQGRQRVFQVTITSPIQLRLVDAFIDTRVGTS